MPDPGGACAATGLPSIPVGAPSKGGFQPLGGMKGVEEQEGWNSVGRGLVGEVGTSLEVRLGRGWKAHCASPVSPG